MENELASGLIETAKNAKSIEELIAFAKENGIELSDEKASVCFAKLNQKPGELSDDELGNVSGGGCLDETKTKTKHQSPTCCGVKMVRFSDTWEGDFSLSQYRCPVCQRVKKEVFAYINGELVCVI